MSDEEIRDRIMDTLSRLILLHSGLPAWRLAANLNVPDERVRKALRRLKREGQVDYYRCTGVWAAYS